MLPSMVSPVKKPVLRAAGAKRSDLAATILGIMAKAHRPLTAYDLIDELGARGQAVKPPSVYRVLERLLGDGTLHRIDSLRAFVLCDRPEAAHESAFLVCDDCDRAFEIAAAEASRTLAKAAEKVGFAVTDVAHELHGRCSDCSQAA